MNIHILPFVFLYWFDSCLLFSVIIFNLNWKHVFFKILDLKKNWTKWQDGKTNKKIYVLKLHKASCRRHFSLTVICSWHVLNFEGFFISWESFRHIISRNILNANLIKMGFFFLKTICYTFQNWFFIHVFSWLENIGVFWIESSGFYFVSETSH